MRVGEGRRGDEALQVQLGYYTNNSQRVNDSLHLIPAWLTCFRGVSKCVEPMYTPGSTGSSINVLSRFELRSPSTNKFTTTTGADDKTTTVRTDP